MFLLYGIIYLQDEGNLQIKKKVLLYENRRNNRKNQIVKKRRV